jgi:hypothetical protein
MDSPEPLAEEAVPAGLTERALDLTRDAGWSTLDRDLPDTEERGLARDQIGTDGAREERKGEHQRSAGGDEAAEVETMSSPRPWERHDDTCRSRPGARPSAGSSAPVCHPALFLVAVVSPAHLSCRQTVDASESGSAT